MKARIALLLLLAACGSVPATATNSESAATAPASGGEVHRFSVGALPAFALRDGVIQVPNDGKVVGLGQPPQAVADLLAAAGRPTDVVEFSIQSLLVQDGERVLLFDTGAAGASFAKAGRLPASLRAAGFAPARVTDIFISHHHADHIGGLVSNGALAFPNAAIHMSAPEWAAMRADQDQATMAGVITPKVVPFEPGARLLPSVVAVEVRGHTPGHSAYAIESGSERLLFIGDSAHHSVISVERPEWPIEFDAGAAPDVALTSRRALLQRAATEQLRLFAGHFPFPGVGRVEAKAAGFVWVPERAAPATK